jgi:hypothetical protein
MLFGSVAGQDVYPGSRDFLSSPSNKKNCYLTFFVANIFTKFKIFLFRRDTKKDLVEITKNSSIFNPKNCYNALRTLLVGSGIRDL